MLLDSFVRASAHLDAKDANERLKERKILGHSQVRVWVRVRVRVRVRVQVGGRNEEKPPDGTGARLGCSPQAGRLHYTPRAPHRTSPLLPLLHLTTAAPHRGGP